MQKNNPEIQRTNRTLCAATSELKKKNVSNSTFTNVSTSTHGASVSSSEFLKPRTQKKKHEMPRQSILPSSIALQSSREAEAISKDMELKLLYNDYLQVIMLEHVTKMKSEKMKNTIIRQLATIAKNCAQDEEKLLKLKLREKDIIHLSNIQAELDTHMEEINEYFGNNKIDTMKEIMSHLCSVLEPLDQLRCNNAILPENTEEWLELREAFKECGNILRRIRELINTNAETYQAVHNETKDFITIYNDFNSCQQKFDEALHNLQVLTLKHGAFSL